MDQPPVERGPWPEGFPDVVIHTTVAARDAHPDYPAAKAGNAEAAIRLVADLLCEPAVEALRLLIGGRRPLLLGVHAIEHHGFNAIPELMAQWLRRWLGLAVSHDIMQANRVGHTRARAAHRMVTPARFAGDVHDGIDYVIVDDHVGLGGTIANLRGHIEARGGRVVAVTTLTESRDGRILALRPKTLDALERKHGRPLDTFWRESFGHGIDALTEAEAGNLLRGPSVDAIRTRLAQAAGDARGRGFPAVEVGRGDTG